MNEPNLKKNFAINILYQTLIMVLPFITAPYISRVLGPEGVGIFSYTNSIQIYFSMFGALGATTYGAREIARHRNDRYERSKLFWEISFLKALTTMACLLAWGAFVAISGKYRIYYIILTAGILETLFDISWFYAGMEQFKYILLQNTIFKLLQVVCLFVFVKKASDVPVYVFILTITGFLSSASMWVYILKFIEKVPLKEIRVRRHFRQTLIYFLPSFTVSIYTVLDKTILGLLTREEVQNGFYEQASRVINMAKTVTFAPMNTVLGSRISFLYARDRIKEIRERMYFSLEYILFLGIGICFGLISVVHRFVPLFFGPGYEPVVWLLRLFSPIVVIIGISSTMDSLYYNPAGMKIESVKNVFAGACMNLILNLLLIPRIKSTGAVIASVIAECLICALYLKNCNRILRFKDLIDIGWKKLLSGFLMLAILYMLDSMLMQSALGLAIEVILGVIIYCFLLLVLRDHFVLSMIERVSTIRKGKYD